jgi:hypothetical protein
MRRLKISVLSLERCDGVYQATLMRRNRRAKSAAMSHEIEHQRLT